MPLYIFDCLKCGSEQEIILKIAERDTVSNTCDKCGAAVIRRTTYAPALGSELYKPGYVMGDGSRVHTGRKARRD